jgi:hypothetical protein
VNWPVGFLFLERGKEGKEKLENRKEKIEKEKRNGRL